MLPETLSPSTGKTVALFYFSASLNIIKQYTDTFLDLFHCFTAESSSDFALQQVGNDALSNILAVPIISGRPGSTTSFCDELMGGLFTLSLLFL